MQKIQVILRENFFIFSITLVLTNNIWPTKWKRHHYQ